MHAFRRKKLLVEGENDRAAISGLMRHHVSWPDGRWPVYIEVGKSVNEIFDEDYINTLLKGSGLEILGVMLDADESFSARWTRVRQLFGRTFPGIPTNLPSDGLIMNNAEGLRFGVWIMPNCSACGMLETFLGCLVPNHQSSPLWAHAKTSFAEARLKGGACRTAHIDKAHIHTWLAWQDPPGERLGTALTMRLLDPHAPTAMPFVNWFRQLYEL